MRCANRAIRRILAGVFLAVLILPASTNPQTADESSPQGAKASAWPFASPHLDAGALAFLPLGPSSESFGLGYGAESAVSWPLSRLPYLSIGARVGYLYGSTAAPGTSLSAASGAAVLASELRLSRSLALSADLEGGWFFAGLNDGGAPLGSNPLAGMGLALEIDPARSFGLRLFAGYSWLGGLEAGAKLGLSLRLRPEARAGAARGLVLPPGYKPLKGDGLGVDPVAVSLGAVYPVFYAYYDTAPIGKLRVRNAETGPARDVVARVLVKQFMDEPKASARLERLAPGASADIDLYGLFSDRIFSLEEGTKVPVSIALEYRQYGKLAREEYVETLEIGNRNALVWDDDRKAAAFVSSKDPEAFRLARAILSAAKDGIVPGMNQNLQTAVAVHEGLRLLRLVYQVDPSSSLSTKDRQAVDFLQFPRQTIAYRTGDCDDLSILYASLFESLGLPAAFVTVPGHILVAVDLGIGKDEASRTFQRPGDLIEKNGTMWLPIETTLQGKSFAAAWDEGARQWREGLAKRDANLYPVREAWEKFPAVVLPGESVPSILPSDKAVRDGFRAELASLVSRELEERVASLQAEFRRTGDPSALNCLGVLYARFGQLDKAEAQFLESARRKETAAVRFNLGSLSFARGKYKDALAHYERALAAGQNEDPKTLLAIARTQSELGRTEAAAATLARLRERDPALAERFSYLGSAAADSGRAVQAAAGGRSLEWQE